MTDDIVERLRTAADPARIRGTEIGFAAMDAADEIERLRRLITEWADAEHADENLSGSWERLLAAENALRKAVGR